MANFFGTGGRGGRKPGRKPRRSRNSRPMRSSKPMPRQRPPKRGRNLSKRKPGGGNANMPMPPYFPRWWKRWGWGIECFVAGTKVIMKHGSDKNIEDVKVGDEVLSYNIHTKQFEPKIVTELFTQTHNLKDGDITVKITFDNGTVTHNTIANPFWSKNKGFVAVDEERCNRVHEWVKTTNFGKDTESLETGDTLFVYSEEDGELNEVQVEKIEYVMEENIRTYDIQVEDNHTFFANGILTHNSGDPGQNNNYEPPQQCSTNAADCGPNCMFFNWPTCQCDPTCNNACPCPPYNQPPCNC